MQIRRVPDKIVKENVSNQEGSRFRRHMYPTKRVPD